MTSKSLLTSKTFWFNLLGGIAAVGSTYAEVLPPKAVPYVMAAGGIANIVLRLLTKQPITGTSAS